MTIDANDIVAFEDRKRDHIRLALDPQNQTLGQSGLASVHLVHEALPEINFDEITLATTCFKRAIPTPFLVSSMTAGHDQAQYLNEVLATVCAKRGWLMGVGSQRRQLTDPDAHKEWQRLRRAVPKVRLLGNIGLSQLIQTPVVEIQRLVDSLAAEAMIIHTNPLQEALQPEGTPQFSGGLAALGRLCRSLTVPVILKETGCGFSKNTLKRLCGIGLSAVDISGLGGTHWGRIEGQRVDPSQVAAKAAETFASWGISTVKSLHDAVSLNPDYAIWGSGGVRSGLDAAKLLAMGAQMIGFAKPILAAALESQDALDTLMCRYETELRIALFCTGHASIAALQETPSWHW